MKKFNCILIFVLFCFMQKAYSGDYFIDSNETDVISDVHNYQKIEEIENIIQNTEIEYNIENTSISHEIYDYDNQHYSTQISTTTLIPENENDEYSENENQDTPEYDYISIEAECAKFKNISNSRLFGKVVLVGFPMNLIELNYNEIIKIYEENVVYETDVLKECVDKYEWNLNGVRTFTNDSVHPIDAFLMLRDKVFLNMSCSFKWIDDLTKVTIHYPVIYFGILIIFYMNF